MSAQVNQTATFMLCQKLGKNMIDRGYGKIINIASKHAVVGITKALQDDAGRNAEITKRIPAARWGEPAI